MTATAPKLAGFELNLSTITKLIDNQIKKTESTYREVKILSRGEDTRNQPNYERSTYGEDLSGRFSVSFEGANENFPLRRAKECQCE